ncbi:S1 RNA-binding domain-containing protein [Candidatus Parcubacteria bacterium]|nr:MAG: S1 RNA-binding domain-containing protein [Candidatus Parcubacteria bacterium]
MTVDLLYQFRIDKETLEQEFNAICRGIDFDKLLLDKDLVRRSTPKEGDFVKGKVILLRNDAVFVDLGAKEEATLPYFEDGYSNEDLDIGDEATFLVQSVTEEGSVKLTRKNVEFMLRQKEIISRLQVGDVVLGQLVQHSKNGWIVDIDGLRAFLPSYQEFLVAPKEGPESLLNTKIEVEVETIENDSVTLSRKAFAPEIKKVNKSNFMSSLNVGDLVNGTIKNITDFGIFIQIAPSIIGLCHSSDAGDKPLQVGSQLKCRVLKIDREKHRVSLGIRQVTEPTWDEIVSKYNVDDKVLATVKSIVQYGAFIEIEPGVSGLIHVSDLSWSDHIKHPREILKEGEKIEVLILNIDVEKHHLSLGLKQVNPDPWENVENKYFVGQSLPGKVINKHKFGIFIEIEKGLEGLAHHTVNSKNLKIGDQVNVSILRIDAAKKKLSLALD